MRFQQIIVLVMVAISVGCGPEPSKPLPNDGLQPSAIEDQAVIPQSTPHESSPKPVHFSLREYIEAFNVDEDSLRSKVSNRPIEITGWIRDLGMTLGEDPAVLWPTVVLAEKENDEAPFSSENQDYTTYLTCYFPGQQPWNQANIGQKVTIRGKMSTAKYLNDCNVVSTESGTPVPRLSSSELTELCESSINEAYKRFNGQFIILEGEVAKNGVDDSFEFYEVKITLTGNEQHEVALHCGGSGEYQQFKDLTNGDSIVVIGKCHILQDASEKYKVGLQTASRIDHLQ